MPSDRSPSQRLEAPIAKAKEITVATLAWFPVRVWRHFLQHNGFVLAAGVSYQALFAIFAGLYLAFAVTGIVFGGRPDAISGLVDLINGYVPGVIGDHGLVTSDQVRDVAEASTSVLSATGAIAVVVVIWTAIGFVTYARRAVRDIVALPPDTRGYVLLKARDLLAAAVFAAALLVGGAFGSAATWALDAVLDWIGVADSGALVSAGARVVSLLVSFVINVAAIAALVRFLIGITVRWRVILPAAALGGGATTVLQIGAGLLLSAAPRNPLLATFAIFIGMLLWFRINGIIILVSAAWIAVTAGDRDLALRPLTEQERHEVEHAALRLAAEVRLREAEAEFAESSWWRRTGAKRRMQAARNEVARVEAALPARQPKLPAWLE